MPTSPASPAGRGPVLTTLAASAATPPPPPEAEPVPLELALPVPEEADAPHSHIWSATQVKFEPQSELTLQARL